MRPAIFISYRREDAAGHAGRIHERLVEQFGADRVFMDVTSTTPGADFGEVIDDRIARCDALVAVIGPRWVGRRGKWRRRRRIDDRRDWVRIEIAAALRRGVRVVPVLVDGARMPRADALPSDVRALARRQSVELSAAVYGLALTRLIESLEPRQEAPRTAPRPPFVDVVEPLGRAAECHEGVRRLTSGQSFEYAGPAGVGRSTLLRFVATDEHVSARFPAVIAVDQVLGEDVLPWLHARLFPRAADRGVYQRDTDLATVEALVLFDDLPLDRRALRRLSDKLPGCALFVASREGALDDVPGRTRWLDGLSAADALRLFELHLGFALPPAERLVAGRLCDLLDGFPWHVRAAAHAVGRLQIGLTELAAAIERADKPQERRAHLVDELLDELTPEQRQVVRRLKRLNCGVHARHLAVLGQLSDPEAILNDLLELGVLKKNSPAYRLSGPVADRAQPESIGPWVDDAIEWLAGWAHEHRGQSAVVLEDAPLLLAALALGASRPREAARIAMITADALAIDARETARGRALEIGRRSARRARNVQLQADFERVLGERARGMGDKRAARRHLRRARSLAGARMPVVPPGPANWTPATAAPASTASRPRSRALVAAVATAAAVTAAALIANLQLGGGSPPAPDPTRRPTDGWLLALPLRTWTDRNAQPRRERHVFRYVGNAAPGAVVRIEPTGAATVLRNGCDRRLVSGDRCSVTVSATRISRPRPASLVVRVGQGRETRVRLFRP